MQQRRFPARLFGLTVASAWLIAGLATADVKPHGLFTDHMVLQRDAKVAVWGTAAHGEKVTVKIQDQEASTSAADGKWMVKIGPLKAGGPFKLTIAGANTITLTDVLVGEVWICGGQSNMEMGLRSVEGGPEAVAASDNERIRLFSYPHVLDLKPQSNVAADAKWHECNRKTSGGFSAVGYFFGRKLEKDLKVPVGLIGSNWGGTPAQAWTSREALANDERLKREILESFEKSLENFPAAKSKAEKAREAWLKIKDGLKRKGTKEPKVPQSAVNQNSPSVLFNAMISPLLPYGIRGAVWYQGESNAGQADQYRILFPAMIQDWRAHFGQGDFPFLFVQLAPFDPKKKPLHQPENSVWAELREAQRLTSHNLPNTAMAVITDVGDMTDIHPRKKRPVGERLAAAALVDVYKQPGVGHSPDYKSMQVDGDKVVIEFDHVGGGLTAHGGKPLTGFTIAGDDHRFVAAQAKLEGNKVVVSSPGVAKPVAVRFGWADFPADNLFNKEGFPATPFRTDDRPFITAPRTSVRKVAGR